MAGHLCRKFGIFLCEDFRIHQSLFINFIQPLQLILKGIIR